MYSFDKIVIYLTNFFYFLILNLGKETFICIHESLRIVYTIYNLSTQLRMAATLKAKT